MDASQESQSGSAAPASQKIDPANCFKILLATDIHLGYKEKDLVTGKDSFIAFEEILWYAKDHQVDFVLLGGDLFHDTNPSKEALHRCLELLKKYTLGDTPIGFEILSDHAVNYDDPNINVAIPVFSIHGNHDDPSGHGGLSSMDLLSTSGLLNYFGRCDDLNEVKISPILMKKGESQLAMYGLSHIHDNRLARLFRDTKVTMEQPDERSGDWFSLMVLHQNRVDRGPKNYIPEEVLPDFLDFVLWGHEHDCRVEPEENHAKKFFVSQPGSSVATSLSEGESIEKKIALLHVCGNLFKCEPIKLQTVRPFVFKSIVLEDYDDELDLDEGDVKPKVKQLISKHIDEMIEEAKKKETTSKSQPKKPLIRLRVAYQNEAYAINEIRFGQQYNELVANPTEIVKMQRTVKRTKVEKKPIDEEAMSNAFNKDEDDEDDIRLEDYVDRYFKDPNNAEKLQVLSSTSLSEACRRLAEYHDEDAANQIVDMSIKEACKFLNEKLPEDTEIDEALVEFYTEGEQVFKRIQEALSKRKSNSGTVPFSLNNDNDDDDGDGNEKENQTTSNKRGARGGRTTAASRSAASKQTPADKPAATSGRGRGSSRATNSRSAAAAGPSPRNGPNTTTRTQQQPTIQQSLTRRSTRQPAASIVYDLDDSD